MTNQKLYTRDELWKAGVMHIDTNNVVLVASALRLMRPVEFHKLYRRLEESVRQEVNVLLAENGVEIPSDRDVKLAELAEARAAVKQLERELGL